MKGGKKKERQEEEEVVVAVKTAKTGKKKLFLPVPTSLASYTFPPHLVTTRDGLRDTLSEFGVAIIPSVLTAEECLAFVDRVWETLLNLTCKWDRPIKRDDEGSWVGLLELFPMHSMLLQHHGLGHAEFVWALRQHPVVVDTFAHLWGVRPEELLVSFDGLSIHMPPETTGRGSYKGNTWYHTDQRLCDSTFKCVQSWVTPVAVNAGDATLTVLLRSHAYHSEFARRFNKTTHKEDWYKLGSQEELDFFVVEKGCTPVSIACPAGSMVFWDSRTMHAGQESLSTRAEPNFRMTIYLCYLPRSLATDADLKKKQKAFNEGRMTSHWPHRPILFGKSPRTYGKTVPSVTKLDKPNNLTGLGRTLAGF